MFFSEVTGELYGVKAMYTTYALTLTYPSVSNCFRQSAPATFPNKRAHFLFLSGVCVRTNQLSSD